MTLTFQIRRASEADLRSAAALFDGYRQFYGQPADYALAEAFLRDRFVNNDSAVLLAVEPQSSEGLGFVQLYPSFSSVAVQRIWILNDLFVAPAARRRGVGRSFVALWIVGSGLALLLVPFLFVAMMRLRRREPLKTSPGPNSPQGTTP